MHDEMLERRLRGALHDEADRLSFTITPAEMERRLALRRRRSVSPGAVLFVAASIGIGLLGLTAMAAGWFDRSTTLALIPSGPPAVAVATPSPTPVASAAAPILPSLDEMIAAGDPSTVVIAQAHGPETGPDANASSVAVEPPRVQLALPPGHADYEVEFACLSSGRMGSFITDPARFGVLLKPDMPCDGSVTSKTFRDLGTDLVLTAEAPASWRVVVRRLSAPAGEIDGAAEPPVDPDAEEFIRVTDRDFEGEQPAGSGASGPIEPRNVGGLPGRPVYILWLSCNGGPAMRVVFGDNGSGTLHADTDTRIACDGVVHEHRLALPGTSTDVFVAPSPGMTWQLAISSDNPPIELTDVQPGWVLSTGFGPSFQVDDAAKSVSLYAHDKRGPVLVAFSCAGTGGAANVTVETGASIGDSSESFVVDCPADGATVTKSLDVPPGNVDVTYRAPAPAWIAVSVLVPDPSTAP